MEHSAKYRSNDILHRYKSLSGFLIYAIAFAMHSICPTGENEGFISYRIYRKVNISSFLKEKTYRIASQYIDKKAGGISPSFLLHHTKTVLCVLLNHSENKPCNSSIL